MLRYDRIPLRQAGAELRASYGQLGSYTYERCYRAIADGRLTAVAEGRRLFIERQQMPEIARLFGIMPATTNDVA